MKLVANETEVLVPVRSLDEGVGVAEGESERDWLVTSLVGRID